jgi:hypothetical protein
MENSSPTAKRTPIRNGTATRVAIAVSVVVIAQPSSAPHRTVSLHGTDGFTLLTGIALAQALFEPGVRTTLVIIGEEKRFQLCFAAHAFPSGCDERATTEVRSASAEKLPRPAVLRRRAGVGPRMRHLLIFIRYPIPIGRDARQGVPASCRPNDCENGFHLITTTWRVN